MSDYHGISPAWWEDHTCFGVGSQGQRCGAPMVGRFPLGEKVKPYCHVRTESRGRQPVEPWGKHIEGCDFGAHEIMDLDTGAYIGPRVRPVCDGKAHTTAVWREALHALCRDCGEWDWTVWVMWATYRNQWATKGGLELTDAMQALTRTCGILSPDLTIPFPCIGRAVYVDVEDALRAMEMGMSVSATLFGGPDHDVFFEVLELLVSRGPWAALMLSLLPDPDSDCGATAQVEELRLAYYPKQQSMRTSLASLLDLKPIEDRSTPHVEPDFRWRWVW